MSTNPRRAFIAVGALCLAAACGQTSEAPPANTAEVASRVSHYVEWKMRDLGASDAQANDCFGKLNQDMDVHPNVDLKRHEGDPGQLGRIEVYEKAFMDTCLKQEVQKSETTT